MYLDDTTQEIESHSEALKEEKRDSSSEGDFVDSLDTMHGAMVNGSSNNNNNLNVPACTIVKSSSFSGVTEREILRSKIKELYNLYSDIGGSADCGLKEIQQKHSVSETRAGKYHKKAAPHPPNKNEDNNGAIKATLVLKPGIIKSLSPPTEDSSKSKSEIFLAHSPKPKRKNKSNSPISRLMMLPKKMVFWNKDESHGEDKRFSWSMFSGSQRQTKPFADCKRYTKSHEDIQNTCKFDYLCDEDLLSYNSRRKEDHYRVRKLSASPTFCRGIELDLD